MFVMPAAVLGLESHYRAYLREGLRARQADRHMKAALRRGMRRDAELHLQRRWRALLRMRTSLEEAWPGIEVFALRELSAAGVGDPRPLLEHLHTTLRAGPPPLSGSRLPVAGLYGWIRRTLRDARAACDPGPAR